VCRAAPVIAPVVAPPCAQRTAPCYERCLPVPVRAGPVCAGTALELPAHDAYGPVPCTCGPVSMRPACFPP